MTRRIVVVGSGMATTRLVEGLVARGVAERDRVTVLGDEPHAPYNRILLSAVLEGTHRPEALTLRSPGWYADHGVDLRLDARVLDVDRERREVMLVDGERFGYDVLVLATGSIPSLPPIRGLVRMDGTLHPAVHAFRSLDDCLRLDAAVSAPHPRSGPAGPSSSAAACSASRSPVRWPSAGSRSRSSRAASTCCAARSAPRPDASSPATWPGSARPSTPAPGRCD